MELLCMHIHKREIPDIALHMNPLFSFLFTNCTFKYNRLNFATKEGGIATFISINSVTIENSNFTFNEGTAIFLQIAMYNLKGVSHLQTIQPFMAEH
jgi:hypothetical protein